MALRRSSTRPGIGIAARQTDRVRVEQPRFPLLTTDYWQLPERARQGGTRLAQDGSPGEAVYVNYEPASAGGTIAWA